MPKLKTHKGTAKRFKFSGSGKVLRMKGNRSHKRMTKPANVRRLYARKLEAVGGNARRIRRLLPG